MCILPDADVPKPTPIPPPPREVSPETIEERIGIRSQGRPRGGFNSTLRGSAEGVLSSDEEVARARVIGMVNRSTL